MDYKIIDETEYVSIYMVSKYFGISPNSLKNNMNAMGIDVFTYNNVAYMSKSDFAEADRLDKSMIGLKNILNECVMENDDITVDFTSREKQAKYDELHSYFSGLNYFGVKVKYRLISKIYSPIEFYIYNDDKELFKSNIVLKLKLYNKSKKEKFKILLQDDFFKNNKKTRTALIKLAENSAPSMENGINELANFLRLTCQKEIWLYTDEEIITFMELAVDNITKNANILLSKLILNISNTQKCSFSFVNWFDKYGNVDKRDNSPYDDKVYLKLAYMVFNEEYWKEKDMLLKAVEKKAIATTWLYHAMHFVCAWRSVDIEENMPHISLTVGPEEVIRMIKDNNYDKTTWIPHANELITRVGLKNQAPQKTKRYQNVPNLKMYIPESFKATIGMLLALCEAHSMLEGKGSPICKHPNNVKYAVALFGKEYNSLFDGRLVSNRKANKAFMNRIMESGDKNNNNGYLLASYARSHKGGLGTLPEVTSKYLKAKMDGYSVEDITRILFERGVCSFVPYLLCCALYKNEFEKEHIDVQTETIKEIGIIPYDIEALLDMDEKVQIKAKHTLSVIFFHLNPNNGSEIVNNALIEIADGKCVGKNEDVYCIRKAFREECSMPKREHCIGCGQEMYLKTFLNDLHYEIIADTKKFENAKTKAEKYKWKSILEKKLYPTVYEILTSMKYIYKQDVTEYKKMFLGDKFDGNVSIG